MIKVNEEKIRNIDLKTENLYVISDFDSTITTGESYGSLDVITKSGLLGDEYFRRYIELKEKYKGREDETKDAFFRRELWIKFMSEYIQMLKDFDLTEYLLESIIKNSNIRIRKEYDVFIKYLNKNHIPLIILSSGLGNSIEIFLKINKLYYDNIYVISNFVTFDKYGKIIDVPKEVITPVTKNEVKFDKDIKKLILNRNNKLVFGDIPNDIGMSMINKDDNTLTIAFCNFKKYKEKLCKKFDIVVEDSEILDLLINLMNGAKTNE